jgi:hypothetical protein
VGGVPSSVGIVGPRGWGVSVRWGSDGSGDAEKGDAYVTVGKNRMEDAASTRTYVVSRAAKVFTAFTGGFFLFVAIMIAREIATKPYPRTAIAFVAIWSAFVVGSIAWALARVPTRITLTDEVITFQTVLRRFDVPVQTVLSVKPLWSDPFGHTPVLKYRGGKVTVISAMDGFHEFLTRLRELNPRVDVRGM